MRTVILIALLLLGVERPAHAAQGDCWGGVRVGGSFPVSEFAQQSRAGGTGSVFVTYMGSEFVGVGAEVGYQSWPGQEDALGPLTALFGHGWRLDVDAITTTAHIHVETLRRGKVRPYLEGSFGIYWPGSRLHAPSGKDYPSGSREEIFGYAAGAGVDFRVQPSFAIGVFGAYQSITSRRSGVPSADAVTLALTLSGGRFSR